jgi:hypothetical protein
MHHSYADVKNEVLFSMSIFDTIRKNLKTFKDGFVKTQTSIVKELREKKKLGKKIDRWHLQNPSVFENPGCVFEKCFLP